MMGMMMMMIMMMMIARLKGRSSLLNSSFKKNKSFMSMYGKNHYNIVISLQLIKISEKKSYTFL